MFTIVSVSSEGVYYLVNGWKKHNAFWTRTARPDRNGFKTPGLAVRQFNKLLQSMPEYAGDVIALARFDLEAGELVTLAMCDVAKPAAC